MNEKEFEKAVIEKVPNYLDYEHRNMTIMRSVFVKNNGKTLTGITLEKEGVSPIVYIENEFKQFCKENDLIASVKRIANGLCSEIPRDFSTMRSVDNMKEIVLEKVFVNVVNTQRNEELLKVVPHHSIEDLSVIYRVEIGAEDNSMSFILKNELFEELDISEDELYKIACKNLQDIKPVTVMNIKDIFNGADNTDTLEPNSLTEEDMMIVSSKNGLFGAANITNNNLLLKIAKAFGNDITLLPSSIHELIVIKAGIRNMTELKTIVHEANSTVVSKEDYLSDSVYGYSIEDDVVRRLD